MALEIRKAFLTDADDIFSLVERFATSFKPERKAFDRCLEEILNNKDALLIVAVFGQTIVGYCLSFDHFAFYANGRVAWVEEIMVQENLRKKGVGRELMKSVEEWACSRESKLISLATRRAAPFYEAIGYDESAVFFRKLLRRER